MTSLLVFFDVAVFIFPRFGYWSKFHVNIITGAGVNTIFVYAEFDEKSGNAEYTFLNFA